MYLNEQPHPAQREPLHTGTQAYRRAIAALALAGFTCFVLLYGTQAILPQLADEFRVSPGVSSLTVAAGTGAMALLLIPFSLLADRYGRRMLMRVGLLGATLFAFASAIAPDFWSLVVCRACLGICIAGVPAAAMAYLGEEIAIDSRARAMGVYIGSNALGGMCGRLFSALVTEWGNWRLGLAALAVLGASAAIVFWRLLPPAHHFVPRELQPGLLLGDVRRTYADAGLPWLFALAFLIQGSFVGFYNYLGFRLSLPPYGFGPAGIGAIFLIYAVGIVSSAWAGHAALGYGYVRLLLGMCGAMITGVLLTLVESLGLVIFGLALFTFGFFAAHSVASDWVGRRAGQRRGFVSALYLSSYYLGGSVIGSATGWPWQHGGWPGVVAMLMGCSLLCMVLIFTRLRRLTST